LQLTLLPATPNKVRPKLPFVPLVRPLRPLTLPVTPVTLPCTLSAPPPTPPQNAIGKSDAFRSTFGQ